MRVKFYGALNSLHRTCYKFSEPVLLHLVSSCCKPLLLYSMSLNAIKDRKKWKNRLSTHKTQEEEQHTNIFKGAHCVCTAPTKIGDLV